MPKVTLGASEENGNQLHTCNLILNGEWLMMVGGLSLDNPEGKIWVLDLKESPDGWVWEDDPFEFPELKNIKY